MRHRVAGKRLSRTTPHRKAMRRNLAASLIEHGTIRTTAAKAKEVRPFVEKLITIARKGTLHARRRVISLLQDRAIPDKDNPKELSEMTVVGKLFEEIAPRYLDRPGGYTRIIHLPERRIGDAGSQVLLQLVEETSPGRSGEGETGPTRSARRKRAARRAEAAMEAGPVADELDEETQTEDVPDEQADQDSESDQADDTGDEDEAEEAGDKTEQ